MRWFEECLCEKYGMARHSGTGTNLVYDDMVAKLKHINDAYSIEKEIELTKSKLRQLKGDLKRKRSVMVKSMNTSKRNYPNGIFITCIEVLQMAQSVVRSTSEVEVVKHNELVSLKSYADSGKSDVRKGKKVGVKRVIKNENLKWTKREWKIALRMTKDRNARENIVVKSERPIWDLKRPGEINVRTTNGERIENEVFRLYTPSTVPHPMSRFLTRIAG